jgi:hypothetical protein
MAVRGAAAEALDTASRMDDTAADVAPDVIEPAHGDSGLGHLDERHSDRGWQGSQQSSEQQREEERQAKNADREEERTRRQRRARTRGSNRGKKGGITRVRIECVPANRLCLPRVRHAQPARLLATNLKDVVCLFFRARHLATKRETHRRASCRVYPPTRAVTVYEVSALKHELTRPSVSDTERNRSGGSYVWDNAATEQAYVPTPCWPVASARKLHAARRRRRRTCTQSALPGGH